MGARDLLTDLESAGLSIASDGGRLVICPASRLTDAQRVALREAKPELLALLAADGADDRVRCTGCRNYRPGRCGNHRRAGLSTADVGRDLAGMLQRCPGFDRAQTGGTRP